MTGYLIYPSTTPKGNNAFDWWKQAAARYGIALQVLFYEQDGVSEELEALPRPDFVILRGYNTSLSRWYEAQGVRVINPTEAMLLCRDKLATARALSQAGLPTPKTWSLEEIYGYAATCRRVGSSKFILKLNFGSKGENVFLVASAEEYAMAMEACHEEEQRRLSLLDSQDGRLPSDFGQTREEVLHGCTVLVQEYIGSSFGRDIRVWVCGGEVIGHILRYNDNSFKSNFAAGGFFRQVELPPAAAQLAIDAARTAGLHFAGIDLLYTSGDDSSRDISDSGFTICEVNGNAGFRTAPTDIPDGIFRTLFK